MKTIEERAKEYAKKESSISLSEVYNQCLAEIYEKAYIAGATEQKEIDTDKAERAFNEACGWLNVYPWYIAVKDEFRKAMEE